MINPEEKLVPSVRFEDDKLVVEINDEEVRRTAVNHCGVYKFNYDHEEYHFIYEKTGTAEKVYFYPLNAYKHRIINLQEDDN